MKIVLVNQIEFSAIHRRLEEVEEGKSASAPPLGLMTLAAGLRAKGHEVSLIDWVEMLVNGEIPLDEKLTESAAEYLTQHKADLVGFTSRCDSYPYTLDIMRHYHPVPSRQSFCSGLG